MLLIRELLYEYMQDTREGEETESIIPHNTFYTQLLGSHEGVFTDPGAVAGVCTVYCASSLIQGCCHLQGCVLCTVILH